jgi:hypothetical protein
MRKLQWLGLYLATERPRALLVGFGMPLPRKRAVEPPISALNSWFVGGS